MSNAEHVKEEDLLEALLERIHVFPKFRSFFDCEKWMWGEHRAEELTAGFSWVTMWDLEGRRREWDLMKYRDVDTLADEIAEEIRRAKDAVQAS